MRLIRFGIANYRSFGGPDKVDPAEAELPLSWIDYSADIVLIAGENNVGKTSLLAAYRDFRTSGHTMFQEDFHKCDPNRPVLMELVIEANAEDDLEDEQTAKWFSTDARQARVRKVWEKPGEKFKKYSFDPIVKAWSEGGFGGFDTILQSRLPEPIHIGPNMGTDDLTSELNKLFKEVVYRYISDSETAKMINGLLQALASEISEDQYIKSVADRVSDVARDVFPSLAIKFENPVSDKGVVSLLDKQTSVQVEFKDSPKLDVSRHGHGSQRVFVLSALSALASELSSLSKKGKRPADGAGGKIIQIEEPELFLSPTATRRMKQLLYKLAAEDKIQVVACTHSPVMIDFSRPRQSVVRVTRADSGSKVFQSSAGSWGKDHAETLRLMYQWNPALSEAIFANKVILVEGETEFAAITRVIELMEVERPELDIHIIDCKGKGNIQFYQKLLREMGRKYMVIHDADVKFGLEDADSIRRWAENEVIWNEINEARMAGVAACGFVFNPDFEQAHNYSAPKKHKMLDAMAFVAAAHHENKLVGLPLHSAYEHIRDWTSPFTSIEVVRERCS